MTHAFAPHQPAILSRTAGVFLKDLILTANGAADSPLPARMFCYGIEQGEKGEDFITERGSHGLYVTEHQSRAPHDAGEIWMDRAPHGARLRSGVRRPAPWRERGPQCDLVSRSQAVQGAAHHSPWLLVNENQLYGDSIGKTNLNDSRRRRIDMTCRQAAQPDSRIPPASTVGLLGQETWRRR